MLEIQRPNVSDTYLTIETEAQGLYKEQGSRFLAFAYPLRSEGEVKPLVDALKLKYHDARHHCYAWRLGPGGEQFRANDDGEPAGSAGKPILGQLLSRGLTNLLVVVVRYFGGIKLGVPGLIASYRAATLDALDAAAVVERTVNERRVVEFDYLLLNPVMKALKESVAELSQQQFGDRCSIAFEIRKAAAPALLGRLSNIEGVTIKTDSLS